MADEIIGRVVMSTSDPLAADATVIVMAEQPDADDAATGADIALSALQRAAPDGGSEVSLTIPLFGDSTPTVATEANGRPTGTECAS